MIEEYSTVEDARIGHLIDPEQLRDLGQDDLCKAPKCSLWREHDGPHLEAHHITGRVYKSWGDGKDPISSPSDVSEEALSVVKRINWLRDEAFTAIESASMFRGEMRQAYKDLTKDEDPILYALIHSNDIWPDEYNLMHSGTENSHDKSIREELVDMFAESGEE